MTRAAKTPPAKSSRPAGGRRLKGEPTGEALIAARQASPYRDIEIEPKRERMPVRDVLL